MKSFFSFSILVAALITISVMLEACTSTQQQAALTSPASKIAVAAGTAAAVNAVTQYDTTGKVDSTKVAAAAGAAAVAQLAGS